MENLENTEKSKEEKIICNFIIRDNTVNNFL